MPLVGGVGGEGPTPEGVDDDHVPGLGGRESGGHVGEERSAAHEVGGDDQTPLRPHDGVQVGRRPRRKLNLHVAPRDSWVAIRAERFDSVARSGSIGSDGWTGLRPRCRSNRGDQY